MNNFNRLLAALALMCLTLSMMAQSQSSSTMTATRIDSAVTENEDNFGEKFSAFSDLAPTGLLMNRCHFARSARYWSTNVLADSTAMNRDFFGYTYASLMMAATKDQYQLPDPESTYMNDMSYVYPADYIPLYGLAYQYNYIRDDALSLGYIAYSGDKFRPLVSADLYMRVDTVFVVTPQRNAVHGDSVTFSFPALTENLEASIDYLLINGDDGQGFQRFKPGETYTCVYGSGGVKDIIIKLFTHDGQYLQTHFFITVINDSENLNSDGIETRTRINFTDNPPRKETIVGTESIDGSPAKLDLYIFGHCDDDTIRKPLIMVDGFEPKVSGNSIYLADIFRDDKLGSTKHPFSTSESKIPAHQVLFDAGYDLIFVDWADYSFVQKRVPVGHRELVLDQYGQPIYFDDFTLLYVYVIDDSVDVYYITKRGGQDYVQNNAYALEKAIEFINKEKAESGHSGFPNQLIGMSMGATVCKWALLDMEQRGIDHGVENYFGYDGPNRGANITVGLQALLRDFQSVKMGGKTIEDAVPEIRNGIQVVRSKFAVSRLLAQGWVNDKFASFRQLEDEFNTKGLNHDGKLVKANYFAIANGAVNGSDQIDIEPGGRIGTIKASTYDQIDDNIEDDIRYDDRLDFALKTLNHAVALGLFAQELNGSIYAMKESGKSIVFSRTKTTRVFGIPFRSTSNYTIDNSMSLDDMPASFTSLGTKSGSGVDYGVIRSTPFIPLASALDITGSLRDNLTRDYLDINTITSSGEIRPRYYTGNFGGNIESFSYYDSVSTETHQVGTYKQSFKPQENQLHVFTYYNPYTLLFYNILAPQPDATFDELNNRIYNFGRAMQSQINFTPGQFNLRSTPNNIAQDLALSNNAELWVNRAGRIGYTDDQNALTNATNSNFFLTIGGTSCTGGQAKLTVNNGCKLLGGDKSIENVSRITIGPESEILLKSGSVCSLSGTDLIIKPGGKLTIENDVTLELKNGSRIIVEKGGYYSLGDNSLKLISENSKIIIFGQADFGKITCTDINGSISIPDGGELQLQGDLSLSGVAADKFSIEIGPYTSVQCDSISLSLSKGKVSTSGTQNTDFMFAQGAKNIALSDMTFTGGYGIWIYKALSSIQIQQSTFSDMRTAITAQLPLTPNNSLINVADSKFLRSSGVSASNTKGIYISRCEFIGGGLKYQDMWDSQVVGISCSNNDFLNIDHSYFARLKQCIYTANTETYLHCTYLMNSVIGVIHANLEEKALTLVQSGLINNHIGAVVNYTMLSINIPDYNTLDANLFVHCNGADFTVPDRFKKIEEIESPLGGQLQGNLDVPQMPVCGAMFQGMVTDYNIIGDQLLAKNNIWICGQGFYGCDWEDIQDESGLNITLLRSPDIPLPETKNIEECVSIIGKRDNNGTTATLSSSFSVHPNPTSQYIHISGANESEYSYVLTDNIGKVLRQGKNRGDAQLDIAALPAGIYFLRLMQDTENSVFKIIKSDK